jgi:hypothetical protein
VLCTAGCRGRPEVSDRGNAGSLLNRKRAVPNRIPYSTRGPTDVLAQLWASARATQQAAAELATRRGVDDDLRFTNAAGHCGEAADELHRHRPDIAQAADIPALVEHLQRLPAREAADRLLTAIAACINDFDVDEPGLQPLDILAAGAAAYWLAMAHHAISGQLPGELSGPATVSGPGP